ncbi:MAG: hypothetical protein ACM65M_18805 [Microcoleus sp.]
MIGCTRLVYNGGWRVPTEAWYKDKQRVATTIFQLD